MAASPLIAFVLNSLVEAHTYFIFFAECAGIWSFAVYWLVKSSELKKSEATKKALEGTLSIDSGTAAPGPTHRG
jgi:hypothetical protein